ncbi:hypothetical protein GCM10028807_03440 [Spirosoma daeguense]
MLSLYPINPNPPTGEYWFQVELSNHGVLRAMAIPATSTLDDLHEMIRESIDFEDDHLYNFYLNWRNPLNGEIYSSPDDDWSENPSADSVKLAELSLYEKQKLLYIFDLADRWEFLITVVRHLPDAMVSQPRLIEKVGESPEQYADNW